MSAANGTRKAGLTLAFWLTVAVPLCVYFNRYTQGVQPMEAIYLRVSTTSQNLKSQEPELRAWAKGREEAGEEVRWYRDRFTGSTMNRPGWSKLWADVLAGRVSKVVVWRLDRLGRTLRELVALRDELCARKVGLVSLRDGLDLSTATGRMIFGVLATLAEWEKEIRAERQLAGIAEAKAEGKRWGGRKPGTRITVTEEKEALVKRLAAEGESIAAVARVVGLSRKTVYRVLAAGGVS
jgi:DNA invertase Pin-like site-specific DNA recombinase